MVLSACRKKNSGCVKLRKKLESFKIKKATNVSTNVTTTAQSFVSVVFVRVRKLLAKQRKKNKVSLL